MAGARALETGLAACREVLSTLEPVAGSTLKALVWLFREIISEPVNKMDARALGISIGMTVFPHAVRAPAVIDVLTAQFEQLWPEVGVHHGALRAFVPAARLVFFPKWLRHLIRKCCAPKTNWSKERSVAGMNLNAAVLFGCRGLCVNTKSSTLITTKHIPPRAILCVRHLVRC